MRSGFLCFSFRWDFGGRLWYILSFYRYCYCNCCVLHCVSILEMPALWAPASSGKRYHPLPLLRQGVVTSRGKESFRPKGRLGTDSPGGLFLCLRTEGSPVRVHRIVHAFGGHDFKIPLSLAPSPASGIYRSCPAQQGPADPAC